MKISNKQELRRYLRSTRNEISKQELGFKSHKICREILKCVTFITSDNILAYIPTKREVDCTPIIKTALEMNKKVYIPLPDRIPLYVREILDPKFELEKYACRQGVISRLKVPKKNPRHSSRNTKCRCGLYDESRFNTGLDIQLKHLNNLCHTHQMLALVPGLGFSKSGKRIGRGGGYYDRLLAALPQIKDIGLCFEDQILDEHIIITEVHDKRVGKVVWG